MANLMRFGRRLALPSTRQIKHELVTFALREEVRLKDVGDKKKLDAESAMPRIAGAGVD